MASEPDMDGKNITFLRGAADVRKGGFGAAPALRRLNLRRGHPMN